MSRLQTHPCIAAFTFYSKGLSMVQSQKAGKSKIPLYLAAGLILANLVYHLAVAGLVPLTVDEAHYALYGVHLDLSYFDHPPMVGWLQALVILLSSSEFMLRLLPALCFAVGSGLVYRLSFLIYPQGPRWQGLVAVLLMNSAPMLQLLGWAMVPDTPLLVIGPLFLWVGQRIHAHGRWRDWLLMGLLMGLAGLTKYTAVLLPVALCLALVQHQGLRWLRRPALYAAIGLAAVLISPVLLWNMQHEWISFTYQLNHGAGGAWDLSDALRMQAAQLVVYNPLLYVAGLYLLFKRLGRGRDFAESLCLYSAALLLLVVAWSAGHGELLPHWAALGWVLMTPLLGHFLCTHWHRPGVKAGRTLRAASYTAALYALLVLGAVYILVPLKPLGMFPWLAPAMQDMVGWREAAEQMDRYAETIGAESGRKVPLLVKNWSQASRLAWYARPRPVQVTKNHNTTQFSLWFGHPDPSRDAVLMRLNKKETPASLEIFDQHMQCGYLSSYHAEIDGVVVNKFDFYHCAGAL